MLIRQQQFNTLLATQAITGITGNNYRLQAFSFYHSSQLLAIRSAPATVQAHTPATVILALDHRSQISYRSQHITGVTVTTAAAPDRATGTVTVQAIITVTGRITWHAGHHRPGTGTVPPPGIVSHGPGQPGWSSAHRFTLAITAGINHLAVGTATGQSSHGHRTGTGRAGPGTPPATGSGFGPHVHHTLYGRPGNRLPAPHHTFGTGWAHRPVYHWRHHTGYTGPPRRHRPVPIPPGSLRSGQ